MGAKIRCKHCDTVIESRHRHDFRQCKCGSIFIDGGNDYTRIGWPGCEPYEDWIEHIEEDTANGEKQDQKPV